MGDADQERSTGETAATPRDAGEEAASVRAIRTDERDRIVAALARAFYDDPVQKWFFPDDRRRMARLNRVFALLGREIWFPHQLTYTTDRLAGAVVCIPPERWRMGFARRARLAPRFAATIGLRDLPRAIRGFNLLESKHPARPHYYVAIIGVEPGRQGKGLGTALFGPLLERWDSEAADAYLEATSLRSRACYERLGFELLEEFSYPQGPPSWTMWRAPR